MIHEKDELVSFPPLLQVGIRVWTEHGFQQHGPLDGPKQDIPGPQAGVVIGIDKPWMTMDQLLYTIRWDSGQTSKHYAGKVLPIGHFKSKSEFMDSFTIVDHVELRVGPRGGFRAATFRVQVDGKILRAETRDRDVWREVVDPAARRDGARIVEQKE